MRFEWDASKARLNLKKHGVDFADAATALEDPLAATVEDTISSGEARYVTLGTDALGRLLVVVPYLAGRFPAHHLGPPSDVSRATAIRGRLMRKEYDFSKAKRGPVVPVPPGKTRITIRLDDDVLAWFRDQVHRAGGGSYQSLINQALRDYMASSREPLEEKLPRVVREELQRAS